MSKLRPTELVIQADVAQGEELEMIAAALERARVVGVLDGWAEKNSARYQLLSLGASLARVSLVKQGAPACHFDANTPDAARAAAARAIEAGEV